MGSLNGSFVVVKTINVFGCIFILRYINEICLPRDFILDSFVVEKALCLHPFPSNSRNSNKCTWKVAQGYEPRESNFKIKFDLKSKSNKN